MSESMTELLPVPCNKSENYDENDKNVTDCDKRVTDKSVTKLSTCVLEVLELTKEYEWSPKEVALELHANPSSIRKILGLSPIHG